MKQMLTSWLATQEPRNIFVLVEFIPTGRTALLDFTNQINNPLLVGRKEERSASIQDVLKTKINYDEQ